MSRYYNQNFIPSDSDGSSVSRGSGSSGSGSSGRSGSGPSGSSGRSDGSGIQPLGTGLNTGIANFDASWPTNIYNLLLGLNGLPIPGVSQEYIDLLSQFMQQYRMNQSTERDDLLFQYFLQMLSLSDQRNHDSSQIANEREYNRSLTADERAYNERMRDEQRAYDSPANSLARLMGAGIGRDQAIQMLGGSDQPIQSPQSSPSASGVGSGSGVSVPSMPAPSGTHSLGVAGAVLNGIGSLFSLITGGVSMAQGIQQVNMLKSANFMTDQQMTAFNSMQNLSKMLAPFDSIIGQLSNAEDVINTIRNSKDPSLRSIADSPDFSNVAYTTYGREQLNSYWKARRDSRDQGTLLDEFIQSQKLQNVLTNMNIRKAGAELSNIDADTIFKNAQVQEVFARICLNHAQVENVTADTELKNEMINYNRLQQDQQQIINDNLRMEYELNSSGFPMLKQNYLDEIEDEFKRWTVRKKLDTERMDRFFEEESNQNHIAYLANLYYNAAGDFAESHPNLYELCVGLKSIGAFDKVASYGEKAANAASLFFLKKPLL